jgi:hypothetical protein
MSEEEENVFCFCSLYEVRQEAVKGYEKKNRP